MERRVAVVVEDDEDIRELMAELLGQSGFTVHASSSGTAGVAAVHAHDPAVVTVDLGLPDIDGYEVTRQVRQFSDAYVVMLTARTEEIDTLQGLDAGADDYITKPFRPRELRARIEAMLRRPRTGGIPQVSPVGPHPGEPAGPLAPASEAPQLPDPDGHARGSARSAGHTSGPTAPAGYASGPGAPVGPLSGPSAAEVDSAARTRLELDGITLFPHLHRVEAHGREVLLTPTEFLLLETLLRSGQVVRSKAELARVIRGDDADAGTFVSKADERTVEVHVGNLRRKLADGATESRWLQTVRGVGYRMAGSATMLS